MIEAGHLDNGTVVPGTPDASGSFTATDVDGDTLTWSPVGTPDATYGTFSLDPSTGEWTYELDNDLPATQALKEGETVDLTYTVQVSDGEGGTATRTVTITITGTNDAPVANEDTGVVSEAGVSGGGNTATPGVATATGNVLTNDTDVDNGEKATLQVSGVSFGGAAGAVGAVLVGTYGSLVLNANGSYTYTLDNSDPDTQALKQGQSETEEFTYAVVDVNGATSTSTLTITVTGANDQPVITSTEADATGEVVEVGTNVAGTETAAGTLTAADVDDDATQTWSIAATNGTYGTIAIDPATGQWTYTLDNTRPETQALNEGDNPTETFTARVTDEFGAYSEQTITVTVQGSNDDLQGGGDATVSLTEDGSAAGTLQDHVSDVDDKIVVTGFQVDANGDGTDEIYAPGDVVALRDSDGNELGSLTIAENGDYSFTPADNYAGEVPPVTYTMSESGGGESVTQTLTFEITKVADAPELEANKTVDTIEDNSVALGLTTPVLADTGTGTANNDNPERLGAITLTIGGAGADGVTLSTGGMTLTPVGGEITIVLTDAPHITTVPAADPGSGIYHMTTAEYEALVVNPPAESGANFTVTVEASSYEVDDPGAIVPGVDGATSTQIIDVDVQAVTDGATLAINATPSDLTFAEDGTIDLSQYLTATLTSIDSNPGNDTDGSETYWYTVEGLPVGSVVTIDGVATTISASTPTATSPAGTSATPPTITVTPPADYSGTLEDVTITLHSRDTDSDSTGTIDTITSSVTLDLHVTPVAGDVTANNVTTAEDTAVTFLAGVRVTDTGTGSEVIDLVSFTVPADWTVTPTSASAGWDYDLTGSTATITFDDTLTQAQREAILDAFTITPPAHSSADATITLSITTTDTSTVDGSSVSNTQTVDRNVTISVTPVAEETGTDSNNAGGNDVTMIDDHAYSVAGTEDAWFALGTTYTDATNIGGGHDLLTGWSNEDTDEFVYAVLTPTLESDTPEDTVFGAQFRYSTDGGTTWVTLIYGGEPLWVPQPYLDTLQVKLPPDVSGTMTIGVQTGTVDYDDDAEVSTIPLDPPHVSGPGVNVAVSGSATLTMVEFDPVADEVTMALNARASGLEDTEIPLAIRTTSSDPSETFNVTISGIPEGAKITYGGTELTVTGGSVTIENFSNTVPMTITPPPDSNEDFTLTVGAVSVDGGHTSAPVTRTITVSVTGVVDIPVVTLAPDYSTTEAVLDAGDHMVALSKIVEGVASSDTDGSETATLRITGLEEGFSVSGATMVVSGTGGERVWVVAADKLDDVSIVVPENYSGTVNFKVAGVTTENDGDSRTGVPIDISFTVTPSPEAEISGNATLVEDEVTALDFAIVHQNGDTNEALGQIYLPADYASGADYTLYMNGVPIESAGLATATIEGVDYYVVPADQVGDLGAMGASDLDGSLGRLEFLYEVSDPSSDGTLAGVTEIKQGALDLTATPVTDAVDASITGITMGSATGTTEDANPGDDAAPDTATVTAGGSFTVDLHVDSADTDGSEHLIRVLIEGVPDGVTVTGASLIGGGSWLLVYDGPAAQSIGASGIDVPVEFNVGQGATNGMSDITMTVQAQDRGDTATPANGVEEDSASWTLNLDLGDGGTYAPPVIEEWSYNGAEGTEDTSFALGDVMDATVSIGDGGFVYSYTVAITGLPAGTTVEGMTLTSIGGVPTWTATVTVPAGGDSQPALDDLLAGIHITPPENSNDNNADFEFDAKLTASVVGGGSVEADAVAAMPVVPVTDPAVITVTAGDVGEGSDTVTATIDVRTTADGVHGEIVDGKLYVQVAAPGNEGGTVTDANGDPIPLTSVSGVTGVPNGDYYVTDVEPSGGSVELAYTAADGTVLEPGDVTFTAHAQTQETGAANQETASASDNAAVEMVNNGVTVTSEAVSGSEAATSEKGNAIELSGLSVTLNDNDGSESIRSILLSGVPVGFLLYVGNSAGDATLAAQASNAGGDGTTNTWVLSDDGELPPYVAMLPAANWSGTLDELALVVESGEASLPETRVDTVPLEPVTVDAVADGVTIEPTLSFGREGEIIALNLNAAMVDSTPAIATVADGSTETTTLQITGLGEHAAFYVGGDPVTGNAGISVSYDEGTDTYTLAGLTQADLDGLGFKQAASALADHLTVTAWTVESANGATSDPVTGDLALAVRPVLATTSDDSFIWDGEAINGRAGEDTVVLRHGESLTGEELAGKLRNIETIDLGIDGGNAIADLTPEQLQAMTDGRNLLTIRGSAEDGVSLSGDWNDNGDGTYTGTIAGTTGVTLTIDGDVTVTPPASGFDGTAALMSFGSFDDMDGFGLASLDGRETPNANEPIVDPVSIDEVLSTGSTEEDLAASLPEEVNGRAALSDDTPRDVDVSVMDGSALRDELQSGALYEV